MSSNNDSKKNLMLALGAGAVIIGAAIVYSMWSSSSKEEEVVVKKVTKKVTVTKALEDGGQGEATPQEEAKEEVVAKPEAQPVEEEDDSDEDSDDVLDPQVDEIDTQEIGEKLEQQGLNPALRDQMNRIETQYFLKLLQFVGKSTADHLAEVKAMMTKQRRQFYVKNDWESYNQIVEKVIRLEDTTSQAIVMFVLEQVHITEMEFTYKHQEMSQSPQYAEFVMAAQQGKLEAPTMNKKVTLTKEETLIHLKKTQEVQMEQMRNMGSKMNVPPPTSQAEQLKLMTEMMVEQCKAMDKIFIDTGSKTEPEEFEQALMHYCANDPQVAQQMQHYMNQMRGAIPQGGPGGMGPGGF